MRTTESSSLSNQGFGPSKRRTFLGLGLSGFASWVLSGLGRFRTKAADATPQSQAAAIDPKKMSSDRTDPFEEKLRLLETAWQRKDFRLARALAHSIRSTAIQARHHSSVIREQLIDRCKWNKQRIFRIAKQEAP